MRFDGFYQFTKKNECNELELTNDMCCGSGRLQLASNALNLGNYHCAEDIDRTCCMMTVCNFIVHGVIGEVIWHDSLAPDSWFYGWKVNENLNNPLHKYYGIPHVRSIQKEESRVWQHWETRRLANESEKAEMPVDVTSEPEIDANETVSQKKKKKSDKNKPIQLSLFD